MKPEGLESVYRLSPSQEGILFHTLYEPASSLYFLQLAVTVRGRIDAGVLRAAWEDLVARHSALRTEIHWQGMEKPVQVVMRQVALTWEEEDWRRVPESERKERLERFRAADRERGFDLSQAPLLRLTLIRAADDLGYFVWSFHHIVIDGWCLPILFREVFELYMARLRGEPAHLPSTRPYKDYIAWLQRQPAQATEAFWREYLAGFPAPTPIPIGQAAGLAVVSGGSGGRTFSQLERELSPELSAALAGLARRRRLTPSALLQGAWGLLLGRYAGGGDTDDVVFGAIFSGRSAPVPGIETIVGLFVNTLPVRVRLAGHARVGPWLQEIGDRHAGLVQREHAPLVEIQGWSDVPRGVPLFESLLVLENYPVDRAAADLSLSVPFTIEMESMASVNNYPLTLLVFAEERFLLRLKYETRRFDSDAAARMVAHMESLLEAIASAPEDLPLRDLPMLREAERRQLLREWQEPAPEPAGARSLPTLFAGQVERTPERIALTHEGVSWTYRQLDERAGRIARALLGKGVRVGDRVALCLERSPDLAAVILGVLKTGAAFVPIDPMHPESRRRHVLVDSGAVGLVTDAETAALWQESDVPTGVWSVSLDGLPEETEEPLQIDLSPDLPAYVIYTSGSTGQPKGVLVTHRNVTRLFASAALRFDFGPDDVWTLFHSYAFDFSVWEMWGALLHGGRLVVVPYWTSRSPRDFDALLRRERVTVLNQTPSAFLAWMAEEGSTGGEALALRWVIFGGEALEPAALAPWFDRHGDRTPRLVNMYGITETTVHVTWQALAAGETDGSVGSVIGLPLPGWRVHLLSRGLEPMPVGVPGEICVGGDGVATGYLGQPERTAERFVPDPFNGPGAEPGARLYRSGDLARRRADGALEYLGRIDRQVKIRGFRIELGEIEAALARHPAVREGVVEVRRDRAGESVLVAYAVAAAGRELPETSELRAFLAPFIPEYMLPGALVALPALPLTANGKVDRRALPEPEAPRAESDVAPRNPLEAFLAGLFAETLGVERVGVHDDFFALGGSSISGARLINRLQKHIGDIVHVVTIFDAPTVAQLAAYLAAEHRDAVARVWGDDSLGEGTGSEAGPVARVGEETLALFERRLRPLPVETTYTRNPSAVFVLSPPRSGTTLLRVMLAGHPRLFAPPELELLSYSTLAERRGAFSGRDAFWLEGLIRAVMEALGCDAAEAEQRVAGWESEGLGTLEAYGCLQALLGERRLVDKTPSYTLLPGALERAEAGFDAPFYIHLVRHPSGMIRSFEEAKLDQIFFRQEHPYSRRELAELIWVASHRRILDHLATVPPERQARVRFEDLVAAPERTLRDLCARMGLEFQPAMARPYDDLGNRMADGIHAESRMLGDVKLRDHRGVDAAVADRWREDLSEAGLGGPARELISRFGYDSDSAPLSFSQERLWFLDRLTPGSPAYNIPVAVKLTGQLDVHAMTASLREIVRRHAVLRTRFDEEDGRPVQRVGNEVEIPLPVVDLTALPSSRRQAEAGLLVTAEASRGFDLAHGPLLRARLVRLDDREHAALFTMHHIASDGWSMGVLIRELGALYAAFTAGRPSPLEPLALQYADFARWQRAQSSFEEDLGYWRRRLDGAPAVLELPTDRPRPAVPTGIGGEVSAELPSSALAALAQGATPFMALLAGWTALLHRLTGETDVLVGTPVANRNRPELEALIGFFVNTLVLRTDADAVSFRGLVERVRETAIGAFAHQELPFEKLVEALAPERSLARTPFFQTMFSAQDAPFEALSLPGLALGQFPMASPAAKFDLALLAAPRGESVPLFLTFSRDLYDDATAERLLRTYATLVEAAAAQPEARVSDLPLLGENERAQLLREWTDSTPSPGALVPELFRRQAERAPDAVAVRQEETTVTYRELARRVERLAGTLTALGVGPEVRVGLHLDRSPEAVVSILGVLAAGGAFVPLDPELPAERLAFLMEDAGASRIVTAERLRGALPETALPVHTVEDLVAEENPPAAVSIPAIPANAAAYVLYTSGSTGRPKGVVIEHRSIASYLDWSSGFLEDQGIKALPVVARLSFDAFLKQLLAPLMRGGEVWLTGAATDPDKLLSLLGSREGAAFNGVPALWRTLLERVEAGTTAPDTAPDTAPGTAPNTAPNTAPDTVRAVLLGGDRVTPDLIARTAAAFPGATIWNLYGPTEATANATAGRLDPSREPGLGRPMAGARLHVLDGGLQLLPVGVPGELCIGGGGLARGYHGLPALTAERFVPDPFGVEPGGRLYRTGDRARLRADGELEFLGRLDDQLKVRGVRIEPGEVEAALAAHSAVREAVVAARLGPDGDEVLAAWFVPRDGAEPALADLKDYLRQRLPEAFVPTWLLPVAALPRTSSGKVDRAALPDPEQTLGEAGFVAPASPAEEILAGIWEDLFQRTSVSAADDFFDLGGHSLLAVRLASRIRHSFGFELPLRTIFEHPTIAGLAAALDARARGAVDIEPPIARADRSGFLPPALPLSFPQQRLWILDRIEPGSPVYNMPLPLLLEGDLDEDALARALLEILRRHEVLRTRFAAGGSGEPEQIVEPAALDLPRVDLRGLVEADRETELRRLAADEALRPFDLSRAPMMRATLVDLEERRHLLLLTLHHIAADGASLEILLAEASALYAAFSAGAASPLPELEIQYADFAVWQRRHLQGERLDAMTSWWRERLGGSAAFELPADRPRPAVVSHRGGTVPLRLSPGLAASLREIGRREGATLFMVGLAAFQALLARRTGRREGVLGSPTANRDRREIEGLIGFFVNMLVLRGGLLDGDTFASLLARTRESALGAYAHRDLPFERLVEALHPERDPGRNPLFQIVFQLLPAARPPRQDGLALRPLDVPRGTTQFDIGLTLADDGQGLAGSIEYAADLYDRPTILRLAESLVRLLEGIAVDPGARLDRIALMSPVEAHQVLHEWNDLPGSADSAGLLVHPLFEQRAAAAPDAVALLCSDESGESVTYGELNRRANRLAHHLRRRGAGPETPVAVLLERSIEQIVAFLAILKAGGAYVPVDPGYPQERIDLLIADTGARIVLTAADLADPHSGESEQNPEPGPLFGSSLAYVVFTSGSTGRPKGVAAVHEAVVRLVRGRFADLGPDEVFLHISPPSFDASTLEIWAPLVNGGRLAILPSRTPSLEELEEAIARHGVTTVWLTTGLFRLIVDRNPESLRPARQILTGGEVMPLPQALRVLGELPGRLVNFYGPTENTTFTTSHPVTATDARRGAVPIGRPIDEGRVAILDSSLDPVPAGVPGELYTGGLGLARGYFGRPDLTAERFVPDPYAPQGMGERLYRSGDLARWLPDGSIEFLGRIDAQVKLRGFRIEPAEIETALAAHPGVEAAAVAVRGVDGDRRLVAWFVPAGGDETAAADLRAWLKRSLPDFMVPAAFVPVGSLPLMPSGKVDRAALPEPSHREDGDAAGGEPRTATEATLASIWRELLGVPTVGVDSDFFELGGHSLLAIQLVSRIRETFGVEIPLRSLFERPTLAAVAGEIDGAVLGSLGAPPIVPIVPVGRDEPLPLSYAQQRLWMLDQMEIGLTAYNLPLAMRLLGALDVEALRASLGEIVRRHEALRTGFGWRDGNPVQEIREWDAWEGVALPVADLGGLPAELREAETMRLARAEAARPFELEWDPLMRLALLRLGAEEHALLSTLHHIIADGWSLGVLVREMSALYPAVLAQQPSPLPELTVQYADYSVWQRRWLSGEGLDREIAWWRHYLEAAPVLDLPTDRPHRSVASFEGGSRGTVMPREVSDGLAALCRAERVTPFMALLAAWTALLVRHSGQSDIVVGSPVANRDRLEIEGLIGFFVNTLVLRNRAEGDPDARGLLGRVRESVLGAFAHQEMPFQKLVEVLQPDRSLQRSPFFQVFFSLQNAPIPAAELPGLTLESLAVESGTSKFELALSAAETPDGWFASIEHNRHLFDSTTAERMLRHFGALLAAFVERPALALSELPLFSESERHQFVHEWNDTRWGDWEGSLVHRVFEARAAERPDAVALVDASRSVTYGELDRQANRLARALRRLGVGPEVAVGAFLDSSPELVLAYLAVLKAGGAYVPLSPAYPKERLEGMVEETAAPVVLTRDALREACPAGARILALDDIDGDASLWADEEDGALSGEVTGEGLAYVMYTSGSTGRPKGVAVVHEAIVRLARDSGFASMTPDDVFLQITAVSFDVSTFEIWGALLNGARLAFLSTPALSLDDIGDAVTRHGVTILWLTTGLFGLLVDRRLEDLKPVRQLLAGGDVLPVPQVRRVVEELPGTQMINGYGPTENTTFTTWRTVSAADAARPSIPIGGPIGNTIVHVLDADLRPVPIGVRGELYTGGLGLARGYYGRPDLTAERFVPDPLADPSGGQFGERLYRTGDFARWLPDGGLEFLGRRDVQVKIRGFRIELGEIETVLGRHPAVAEAVVLAREDRPGDRRLVGYVVPAPIKTGDPIPSVADLQAFLRQTLPDYMVPAAFVVLPALPLTANAKVDRAALPAPEDAARESQASYVPPRNELERTIVGIWQEVLGRERIGVNDNFFDLGGHSLLLLQAVSRLNEALGRELPRGLLFEHPTVAALARALGGDSETGEEPEATLELSQERATARRESIQRRGRAPLRPAAPAREEDDEDDEDLEDDE